MNFPPYVQAFRDRHGRVRLYLRKKGCARVALPDPADGKAAFVAAYTKALAGGVGPLRDVKAGTLDALITRYLGSNEFRSLKPNSRETYLSAINFLRSRKSIGAQVTAITRNHVRDLRDEIAADAPGKANLVLKVLRLLLAYALDRGDVTANVAAGLKRVKGGEYRSWTDAELLQFEAHWPRGTTPRLIYELALGTGQRRGDIAKMTWADIKEGVVYVCQEKTGEKVWVPAHASLSDELGRVSKKHAVVVATASGRGFSADYLGTQFAEAIARAGLPSACVLHGLRKAAARRLAEAGASDREIMAITGHTTSEMVTHYTKQADRKVLAMRGMDRLKDKP